jgi:hypothetical protein
VLYDLGVRRGDIVIQGVELLTSHIVTAPPEEQALKRQELLLGAIQFDAAQWIGEFGEARKADFRKAFNTDPTDFTCFYYDALVSYAYTFESMI